MRNVGILITGNEVLSAKTKDTNGPFLGKCLRKLGLPVRAVMFCGDLESDLIDCLSYLSLRCDTIFMTGGLGPTCDDLTAQTVAKFFHSKTLFYEQAWETCLQAFKKLNRVDVPESNKKQAFLPEGSTILPNEIGTAVGFKVCGNKNEQKVTIYCLPGVPHEMEPMFLNFVYPEFFANTFPPFIKTWQVIFLGESAMQTAIELAEKKLQNRFPHSAISYQAYPGYVTYTVSLFPKSVEEQKEGERYLESEFSPAVQSAFGEHILYSQEKTLQEYVVECLQQKNCRVAFQEESCGGALSREICGIPGAQKVFQGSFILPGGPHVLKTPAMVDSVQDGSCIFDNVDIYIKESGAPALDLATSRYPHGHFSLQFSFKKSKIKNELLLRKKLTHFAWHEEPQSSNQLNFISEFKVSTRFDKPTQQRRVALQCLCFLALIMDAL